MWVGWNTKRYSETIKKQVTRYMQNIRLPPTRQDVVKETLKRSQEVAKKCGDKYAIATSDLAVPKTARQIHIQNSPKFDDCFIVWSIPHNFIIIFINS